MKGNNSKPSKNDKFNKKNQRRTDDKRMGNKKPRVNQEEGSKSASSEYASHAYNDMSWYTHNPLLLESACRIPFAYPCGGYMSAGTYYTNEGEDGIFNANQNLAAAGVVALDYVPSIGSTHDGLSAPINIAAREMYARVRKAYSGTLVCDAPDLMLYMLALDGVFSYIAYLKRLYRLLDIYSGTNRYVVEGLFAAMGFSRNDVNNLRENKTRLWGIINTLVADANKWSCPARFDILNRHYWMNDNIYLDKVNSKAQMYVFNPQGFYKFGLDSDSKGQVTVETFNTHDVEGLYAFGRSLLYALSNSEDAYTINGYLARAFEDTPNFRVAELGIGDKQEFVYAEEVLNQIHNATIVSLANSCCTVTQNGDTGELTADYSWEVTGSDVPSGVMCSNLELFDSSMEVPDAINIVVGSRLHATVHITKQSGVKALSYDVSGGTEIITAMRVFCINVPSVYERTPFTVMAFNQNFVAVDKGSALRGVSLITQFDWAPMLVVGYWNASDSNAEAWSVFGDVTNLTSVSNTTMENLHRMCIYSEFNAFGIDT